MDPHTAVTLFGVGAAAIGLWAVARFPERGPQSVRSAGIMLIAVMILQSPFLRLVHPVAVNHGIPCALLLIVLPTLTVMFWAAACLVRSLVLLMAPYRR
jgi:hypothetical protein